MLVYADCELIGEVETVVEFLDQYYKPDRFRGRGAGYAETLIESHERRMMENGHDLISHHDSVRGVIVWLIRDRFPDHWRFNNGDGITGRVLSSWVGSAETDGRFYDGKIMASIQWENGAIGRWPAAELKRVR